MATVTVYAISGDGASWSDGNNIASADEMTAAKDSLAIGETSSSLRATFAGAALPTGATIRGVRVYVRCRRTGSGLPKWSYARILSAGTTKNPGISILNTTTVSAGGAADLWGRAWSISNVNSGLYVDLQFTNVSAGATCTIYVYYVYATITYDPPTVVQSHSDTLSGSISDSAIVTPLVDLKPASDTLSGSITDWAYPAAYPTLGDTLGGSIVDEATVTAVESYTGSDTLSGSISDASSLRTVYLPSDTLTGDIVDELVGTQSTTTLGDTLGGSIDDDLTSAAGIGVADVLVGDISDTLTSDAEMTASDTLDGAIDDAVLVYGVATASDTLAGSISDDAQVTIIPLVSEPRVALDVYTLAGVRVGSGPISGVVSAQYGSRVDEIGSWSATVPATLPNAEQLVRGREVRIRREGEGVVYRGIIERVDITVTADGQRMLAISGPSIAVQLLWANTLLAREYSGAPIATAVGGLLSGTGWTAGSVPAGPAVTMRFDGASIWAALRSVAKTTARHVVEDPLTRSVDVAEVGVDSGLVIRQVEQPHPELAVIPLVSLEIRQDERELWNRVIPLGAGQGVNALTLQRSTRTTPYPRLTATGPDGQPYYYIQDAASIAANGARTRVVKFDDVAPLSNSNAEIVAAANTLHDAASAWLGYHATPGEHYAAEITMLRHIDSDTGQATFRPGQRVRLQWTGITEDEQGRRLWRSVDAMVYVMGYTREFVETGADRWQLELSTTDQHAEGAGDAIADAIEDLWAIKTAMKPYTYREIHGPYVESVATGQPATFPVNFDAQITYLHQARLHLRKRRVKSNVTGSAAGGGVTSSSETVTLSAAGSSTSMGGEPHTHSITMPDTFPSGSHWHQLGTAHPTSAWTQQPYQQQLRFEDSFGVQFGVMVGRGSISNTTDALYTKSDGSHFHLIPPTVSQSESSHRHTIPGHSHTISPHSHTLPTHTHPLEYGIYLGPTASNPQFRVTINGTDRTAALGGPWANDVTLDITQYLVDSGGQVLRQTNAVGVSASQLCDVELTVRSLVTGHSLVPV